MSVLVMSAVWKAARCSGGTLVVLLALADWADDDGLGVFPKQQTLADKARMGKRNVSYVLERLEANGYIERVGKKTGGIIEWRVENDVAKIATLQPIASEGCNGLQTDPSIDPPVEDKSSTTSHDSDLEGSPTSKGATYIEAKTPGSAAAPWLVIELGRLMRENDPKVKLPVGLRELINDEYVKHFAGGGAFSSPEKRRELIAPVVDKPALLKWLDSMRLLIDSDERELREAAQVLRWCQQDSFWQSNILSADKFRKQYPKLRGRWLEETSRGDRAGTRPGDRAPSTAAQLDAMAQRQSWTCPGCGVGYGRQHEPGCPDYPGKAGGA